MKILLIIIIILAIICLLRSCYEVTHFKTTEYLIKSEKLTKGFRIAFISDLHGCEYGRNNSKLNYEIDRINPDFVLIAGDMYTAINPVKTDAAISFLENISSKYPVYYSFGNHESRTRVFTEKYGDVYEKYINEIKSKASGVNILENETISIPDENINIIGLEIDVKYFVKGNKNINMEESYIEEKLGPLNESAYNILLAHNPDFFHRYVEYGADLILSGHNHGGIINVPFLGGLISPKLKLFDKFDRGRYVENDSTMILSAGLGSHTINIRLFNRPELICLQLMHK